jgi:hypothetical protein
MRRTNRPRAVKCWLLCVLAAACTEPPAPYFNVNDLVHITGEVVDQDGVGVRGASLVLEQQGQHPYATMTPTAGSNPGFFLFWGVSYGSYALRVVPPSGYSVPDQQPNPILIHFMTGKEYRLTILLRRAPETATNAPPVMDEGLAAEVAARPRIPPIGTAGFEPATP